MIRPEISASLREHSTEIDNIFLLQQALGFDQYQIIRQNYFAQSRRESLTEFRDYHFMMCNLTGISKVGERGSSVSTFTVPL